VTADDATRAHSPHVRITLILPARPLSGRTHSPRTAATP